MTTPIDWATPKKIAELTGISRSLVVKLTETGEIVFSKNGKTKRAGLMICISSFNKYWNNRKIVKK